MKQNSLARDCLVAQPTAQSLHALRHAGSCLGVTNPAAANSMLLTMSRAWQPNSSIFCAVAQRWKVPGYGRFGDLLVPSLWAELSFNVWRWKVGECRCFGNSYRSYEYGTSRGFRNIGTQLLSNAMDWMIIQPINREMLCTICYRCLSLVPFVNCVRLILCSRLCDGPITRPEQSYRLWLCNCVWSRNLKKKAALARVGLLRQRKEMLLIAQIADVRARANTYNNKPKCKT